MVRISLLSALVVVGLVAGLFVAFVDSSETELLVQTAASGSLSDNGDGTFTLALEGVDDVIWFSERPDRHAGTMSLDAFAEAWRNGEAASDPPNAALEANGSVYVIELRDMTLDAAGRRVSYRVAAIDGDPVGSTLEPAVLKAFDFEDAVLFIDAFPTAVNGQITDS
jgi:hypothetical protein